MSTKTNRWLCFIGTTAAVVLLIAITGSLALVQRARAKTERYLQIVKPLRIGAAYDLAFTKLHDAGIHTAQHGDCPRDCVLSFEASDEWMYRLHLAPPAAFYGGLYFKDGRLVEKSTAMGREIAYVALVSETGSTTSMASHGNLDMTGHPYKIHVHVSAVDFTEFRENAYAFNVACIGSMHVCRTDEYLPMLKELENPGPH